MRRNFPIVAVCLAFAAAVTAAAALQQHQPGQHDHLDHRFDDPERYARSFDDPERDSWQLPDRVIGALGLRPDSAVADLGAGTGYFTMRLAAAVPRGTVYAVDIEPSMLEHIRTRAERAGATNVVTVQAAAASPNLPAPVDVVLIVNTYHHLPDRVAYFTSLQRSLTGAGRVAIVDYHRDSPSGPPPAFRFEASQIEEEMQAAGYRTAARHTFLPRQHFLVFEPASR
jgi:ubiquinone/menaquinone biosynthesis C-methylase UbiE